MLRLLPSVRFALIEEVAGFLKEAAPDLIRGAVELGFQARVRLLNAGHVGVAQSRLREFVVLARLGEVPVAMATCVAPNPLLFAHRHDD